MAFDAGVYGELPVHRMLFFKYVLPTGMTLPVLAQELEMSTDSLESFLTDGPLSADIILRFAFYFQLDVLDLLAYDFQHNQHKRGETASLALARIKERGEKLRLNNRVKTLD